jgi:hypothetical protein
MLVMWRKAKLFMGSCTSMYPTIKNPRSRAHSIFFALIVLVYSGAAPAGAPIPDFFNVTPELPANSVHSTTDLNNIFNTGVGPYTPAMAGKIYPYPLTIGGVKTNPIYNGCYDRQNRLLGPLDANNSCAAVVAANPNSAIYSLFLGYKIACPGGAAGGVCGDTELSMNCQYTQVQAGTSPFDNAAVSTRICSTERGIVRRALGNGTTVSAYVGCHPGEDGTTYPTCNPCAVGTFNPKFDPNTVVCTACTRTINNSDPTSVIAWTSPKGSFDPNACTITGGLKCNTGYSVSSDGQSCTVAKTCNLSLNLTPKDPSAGKSDGSITATVFGSTGATAISMTSPSAMAPTTAGPPAIFSALAKGLYTITATDTTCSTSASTTLADKVPTPQCTSCPSGSTLSGTDCTAPPTTTGGGSTDNYTCQGAGGCTSQPCTNITCSVGSTFGQVSASDPTPRTCDGNSTYTSFGGNCSFVSGPVTTSPSSTCPMPGFSLSGGQCTMACTPAPQPTCNLTLGSVSHTNPTTVLGTDGTINMTVGGGTGTTTYSISPTAGTVNGTPSGASVIGLSSGTYQVTAADTVAGGNNCKVSSPLTQLIDPVPTPSPTGCSGTTPTIVQTSNAGVVNSTRTQSFAIGALINPGDIYVLMVYSHSVASAPATAGDTPTIMAAKMRDAINATSAAQWSDQFSQPANGTPGYKPSASASGGTVTVTLNYQNQFAAQGYRGCDGWTQPPQGTPPCDISLNTQVVAQHDPSGGKIMAFNTGGGSNPIAWSISPFGGFQNSVSPTETDWDGITIPQNTTRTYTITATDSMCTKTADVTMYWHYYCQDLTCAGGPITYFADSSDIPKFQASGGQLNATDPGGQTHTTCEWVLNNGNSWGSPYVVCGGNDAGGSTCVTHTSNQVKTLGEASYWVSTQDIAVYGATACTVNGW